MRSEGSPIDFLCKHHILLEHEDGSRQPMDVSFFQSEKIAPGTWQILSDGDYSYLVEGENEALVIVPVMDVAISAHTVRA